MTASVRQALFGLCLVTLGLFLGASFAKGTDFREQNSRSQASVSARDLATDTEVILPCLNAAGFETNQLISNIYKTPVALTAADFNDDGLGDIVVAYYGSNSVVLYTNEGGGDWSTQVLGNIEDPSDVFAADLNGDGMVDVVATSMAKNATYWFQNTKNGWVMYTIPGSVESPTSVFVADINGDTKPDVVVGGGELLFYLNLIDNANRNHWNIQPAVENITSISSIFATDVDKNGFIDIVIASTSNNLVGWLNNTAGDGTDFVLVNIAQPTGPVGLFVTDVNNDTWPDVVTTNSADGSTTLYYNQIGIKFNVTSNNSAPTLSSSWAGIYVARNQSNPQGLFVTDISGNGQQDIIVTLAGAGKVVYYDSNVSYTWTERVIGNYTNPSAVFAYDLSGNFVHDIVVASAINATIGWFEELCETTLAEDSSSSHVVGWSVAGGVIGGLLILWILLIMAIAVRDYIKYRTEKAAKARNKEAKTMLPPAHDEEEQL
jgi:hypothetical protein